MSRSTDQSFPKASRIVRPRQFGWVFRRGVCVADGVLVVFAYRRSDDAGSRLGVTVPKKTGNAVIRNRWKRWIRESFRTQRSSFPHGWDFVVRPKKDAVGSWRAIRRSLPKLATRAIRKAG